MSAYTYKRLQGNDKIRLLRIVTVPKQDKGLAKANGLNLDIETYALDAAPPYECVSYAWVTNERDLHVELFDGTSVSITASLLTALPYLMSACETNHLWIDQLCINQDDLNERSAQVSIMGQIYRGARRLLVWLCQESEDTARFLHLARRYDHEYAIVEDLEICAELGGVGSYIPKADQSFDWYFAIRARGPCPFHTIKDWNLGAETMQVAIELATPYRRSIQSVFNLPWFSRAWVLQEALAASDMMMLFGEQQVPYDVFDWVCASFNHSTHAPHGMVWTHLNSLDERRSLHSRNVGNQGMLFFSQLVNMRRYGQHRELEAFVGLMRCPWPGSRKCTDPRDLIFCLWGSARLPMVLQPNYQLSVKEVFERTARALIDSSGVVCVLDMGDGVQEAGRAGKSSMPSWVPDFSRSPLRQRLWGHATSEHFQYLPQVGSTCQAGSEATPGELNLVCDIIDQVLYVSNAVLENFMDDLWSEVADCWKLDLIVQELMIACPQASHVVTADRIMDVMSAGYECRAWISSPWCLAPDDVDELHGPLGINDHRSGIFAYTAQENPRVLRERLGFRSMAFDHLMVKGFSLHCGGVDETVAGGEAVSQVHLDLHSTDDGDLDMPIDEDELPNYTEYDDRWIQTYRRRQTYRLANEDGLTPLQKDRNLCTAFKRSGRKRYEQTRAEAKAFDREHQDSSDKLSMKYLMGIWAHRRVAMTVRGWLARCLPVPTLGTRLQLWKIIHCR